MSNRILSYKGLLKDLGQDTILLSTKKGEMGYRIVKFVLFPAGATSAFSYESFVSIWKTDQSGSIPADGVPDFSDNRLLGCGYYTQSSSAATNPEDINVFFDHEIFNQDIYVTHSNSETNEAINYYIELEVIKLSEDHAMVATLKDIRNND